MRLLLQLLALQGKINLDLADQQVSEMLITDHWQPFAHQFNSSPVNMFLRSASDQKKGLELLTGHR